MKAVILFSHGSTLCGAGDALETHVERMRETFGVVEVGFMNYSQPTFEEAVAKVSAAGADEILIVPFFLVPGYFVKKSLPDRVATAQIDYPALRFKIAAALGYDDLLAEALISAAANPLPADQWRQGLQTAARACRYSEECPIYGMPLCPKTYRQRDDLDV